MTEYVTTDGTEVPMRNIERSELVDYDESVPETFDLDILIQHDNHIIGEAQMDDGSYITLVQRDEGWAGRVVDEAMRDVATPSRAQVATMMENGLTAAESMDYLMVKEYGLTVSDWADTRGISHQAVSANVRKARDKLGEE